MKIPRHTLAHLLAQKSLHQGITDDDDLQIAAYLLATNRTNEVNSLLRDIQSEWAKDGYVNITAISANPLSSTDKSDIDKLIHSLYPKSKTINLSERIDKNLIGGVRIEFARYQLDLSILGTLNRFKRLSLAQGGSN
ncbi:MAG TPA: F0F1 ATP synthase subunit delta [Candidatus Saccharimonadales bacterium]|jgi:F0F1-type ATP synthase delta subunit|nr:F0F1 ATP synthase subunit delta [Candidatus Saccharimonadales bacterium]